MSSSVRTYGAPRTIDDNTVTRRGARGDLSKSFVVYHPSVAMDDGHGLGYTRVDDEQNVPFLVATMEMTSRWDAIRDLRRWERERLGLWAGERLIDGGNTSLDGLGSRRVTGTERLLLDAELGRRPRGRGADRG